MFHSFWDSNLYIPPALTTWTPSLTSLTVSQYRVPEHPGVCEVENTVLSFGNLPNPIPELNAKFTSAVRGTECGP